MSKINIFVSALDPVRNRRDTLVIIYCSMYLTSVTLRLNTYDVIRVTHSTLLSPYQDDFEVGVTKPYCVWNLKLFVDPVKLLFEIFFHTLLFLLWQALLLTTLTFTLVTYRGKQRLYFPFGMFYSTFFTAHYVFNCQLLYTK